MQKLLKGEFFTLLRTRRAVLLPPGKQSLGGFQEVVGDCHHILGIRSVFRENGIGVAAAGEDAYIL